MSKINISLGFTADTSQAKKSLEDLAQSLNKITQNPPFLLDDNDLKDAVSAAKDLGKHLKEAYNVDTGKLDLSKFSQSLSKSGQDLKYFQNNLSKLGADGEQAFLNLAKSIAKADAPTLRLNGHVKNLLDDLIKVSRWQLSSSIMHGFMGAVQTAYGYAQDLNRSLTDIGIVTSRNAEEMAQFAEKANNAAKALSTTTVDYTDAALIYYQQGLEESDIEERTAITVKMANAVGQSVETVSEQLTAIWNNYYDGSKSLEYYADVLMRLGADTASSSDEISEGLGKFSAVADSVGLSYEYAASALATITATTRESANTVGTALKTLFSRIQGLKLGETLEDGTDLNKYSEALATVGVSIKTANGDLKDMDDILDEVGARWQDLASDQKMALAQTVAGVRQYNQFVALMDKWDYFQENLNSSLSSTGSLTEQAEIYADSWKASEKRVRAAAEGIYQSLIDDNFFIDFNDGLAKLLEGIDGFVTGLGGMHGVLTSIGSLILMTYSKEIPSALDKVGATFEVLTGKARKNMSVIQQQNINQLTEFVGGSQSAQVEAEGLAKVARMKKELTDKSHMLSRAQIEEYQTKIQSIQSDYEKVQSLYEEAAAKDKLLKQTEISYDNTGVQNIRNLILSINEAEERIGILSNSIQNTTDEGFIAKANTDITILKNHIEEVTKALEDFGLEEKDIEIFKTGFDPSSKKQSEDVAKVYEKITKQIESQRKNIVKLTQDQEKYLIIGEKIKNIKNSWDKNSSSIETTKKAIREYIQELDIVNQKNNLGIDFEQAGINQLLIDLDDVNITSAQLEKNFTKVLDQLEKVNDEGVKDTSAEMDVLENQVRVILNLLGQGNKFDSFFEILRTRGSEAAQSFLQASLAEKKLKREQEEHINIQARLSSGIGELAAQLMNVSGVISSIKSFSELWDSEDASTLEKMTSLLGLFYQTGQLTVGLYKGLTTVTEAYTAARKAATAAEAAGTAGVELSTEAVKKSRAAIIAHPILGAVAAAITIAVAALAAWINHLEKEAKAAKEAAEANKAAVEERKNIVESNTELIRSMDQAYKMYEKTGEGKEDLDKISEQLAETYKLEGVALAKLSGSYEHYQNLLNSARKKRIEELEAEKEETKEYLKSQGEVVNNTAKEGRGFVQGSQYKLSSNSGMAPTNRLGIFSYIDKNVTGATLSGDTIDISTGFDTKSIVKLYDELAATREHFRSKFTEDVLTYDPDYVWLDSWLNKMQDSVETYKEVQSDIELLEIKLGTGLKDVGINSYDQYQNWVEQLNTELKEMGKSEEEAQKIIDSITNFTVNSNVTKYKEIEDIIEGIQATGTQVSEQTLIKLWEELDKGTGKWKEQTLLALNWKDLTEETWEKAAESIQNYNKAIEDVASAKKLRTDAASVLSMIDDGITKDNWADIYQAFDWGNEEQGIIDFTSFLKLTLDEQKEYLSDLAEASITDSLDIQIEKSKEQIQNYKEWLNNTLGKVSSRELVEIIDAYDKISAYLNSENKDYQKDIKEGINWGALGLDPIEADRIEQKDFLEKYFKEYFGYTKEEASTILVDIRAKKDSIDKLEKDIEKLEEEKKVEILFTGKKSLEDYLKDYETLVTLKPNTKEYDKLLEEILQADNSVLVEINGRLNEDLQAAREELESLIDTASTIGDEFWVSTEDINTLAATFPGILDNYTEMKDGMIKLNGEVVKSVLDNAKLEIQSNIEVQRQYLETQKAIAEENIKRLDGEIDTVTQKTELYAKSYSAIMAEDAFTQETIDEKSNETVGEISEDNKTTAESYGETYTSALNNVREFTEKAMYYLGLLKQFQEAETFVEADKILGKLNSTESSILTSTYGQNNPELVDKLLNAQNELANSGSPERKLEEMYETYWGMLQGDLLKEYEAEKEKLIAEKETEEENLASINSLLEALAVQQTQANTYFDNIISGLGSDGKVDKTKKGKELKNKDLLDEVDIYADIDREIESINDRLEQQQEITSRLDEGTFEYLESLEAEKKIIEELNAKLREKQELAKISLVVQKNSVIELDSKIEFADDGRITNSAKILLGLQNEINGVINQFNASKDEAEREILEAEIETMETHYEGLQKAIDQYSDTLDLIRNLDNEIKGLEYSSADIDIKIEESEKKRLEENFKDLQKILKLEVQINENDLKLIDYYIDKFSDGFYDMAEAVGQISSKVGPITSTLANYSSFKNSLDAAKDAGEISEEDWLEGMQQAYDGIIDNLQALNELDREMLHYYENTLSAAKEELDHYASSLEHLTSVLEHYKNIIELVDGEYNFEAIDTILRGQTKTLANELKFAQESYEMLKREKQAIEASMAGVNEGSAAWELFNNELKAITKALEEAEDEMLTKTEEWAEAMKAVMENIFKKAAFEMEMAMTEGMGFDALNDSLDRLSSYQEIYLTNTNEIYELSKLMRTAQQAADKTDNVVAKQKLSAYQKEIETLKNDGIPLSKLELEIAQARYDVLLAEIALEEAQNAKSVVRLQKDNEGNFGYVYTADVDAITSAEQDLADAQNKLYNIGLDATNDYGSKMLELQQQMYDDWTKLQEDHMNGRFRTEEEYKQAEARLIQEYNDLFIAYSDQYTTALGVDVNIREEAWIKAYDSMIDKTQNWQEYTSEYTQICEDAYEQWRISVAENNEIVQNILNNTKEEVEEVTRVSDELSETISGKVIPKIEDELRAVRDITAAYADEREEILRLIAEYEALAEAIRLAMAEKLKEQAQQTKIDYDLRNVKDYSAAMADYLEKEGTSTEDDYYKALVKARNEKMANGSYSNIVSTADLELLFRKYEKAKSKGISNELTEYVESVSEGNNVYWDPEKVKKFLGYSQISAFKTGGYTGEWGSSGRFAVLHEKELVLNATDTSNLLKAAEIIRQVSEIIDLEAVSNQFILNSSRNLPYDSFGKSELEQRVTIEANFPGVQDRFEIEEAFNNLINTASQYANRK